MPHPAAENGILDYMSNGAPDQTIRSRLARILPPIGKAWTRSDAAVPATHLQGSTETPSRHRPAPTLSPAMHERAMRDHERVEMLQRDLGMHFDDATLLREALTHRSYLNEINQAWPSNERLEFLGDAVLGLITTDFLFRRFPDLGEGELTNLRSALVRTETLARFSGEIDLGQYLFLGRGEEMSQGRRRPAGLACAFEALLGAFYLDRGYEAAREWALRFVEPELEAVLKGRLHKNPKSVLQELVQARMQQTPSYHLVEELGPDHSKSFTVEVRIGNRILAQGHNRSKRGAEQAAAEAALQQMELDPTEIASRPA
jgi:ribonuclease III